MYVCALWIPMEATRRHLILRTGIRNSCKLLFGCWEVKSSSKQEKSMPLPGNPSVHSPCQCRFDPHNYDPQVPSFIYRGTLSWIQNSQKAATILGMFGQLSQSYYLRGILCHGMSLQKLWWYHGRTVTWNDKGGWGKWPAVKVNSDCKKSLDPDSTNKMLFTKETVLLSMVLGRD